MHDVCSIVLFFLHKLPKSSLITKYFQIYFRSEALKDKLVIEHIENNYKLILQVNIKKKINIYNNNTNNSNINHVKEQSKIEDKIKQYLENHREKRGMCVLEK